MLNEPTKQTTQDESNATWSAEALGDESEWAAQIACLLAGWFQASQDQPHVYAALPSHPQTSL